MKLPAWNNTQLKPLLVRYGGKKLTLQSRVSAQDFSNVGLVVCYTDKLHLNIFPGFPF